MNEQGQKLLASIRSKLKSKWDDWTPQARADITAAVLGYVSLAAIGAAGIDVSQALAEEEATIANWTWCGSSLARRIVLEVLAEAFKFTGEFMAGLAERLLTG